VEDFKKMFEIPYRSLPTNEDAPATDAISPTSSDQELLETIPEDLRAVACNCITAINARTSEEITKHQKAIEKAKFCAEAEKKCQLDNLKSTWDKLISATQEAFESQRERIDISISGRIDHHERMTHKLWCDLNPAETIAIEHFVARMTEKG
jgi:hypothetical protein